MTPEQAAYAAKQIGCKYVIPCHDMPRPEKAPDEEGMRRFLEQFPMVESVFDKSKDFARLMKDEKDIETVVMELGDTIELP